MKKVLVGTVLLMFIFVSFATNLVNVSASQNIHKTKTGETIESIVASCAMPNEQAIDKDGNEIAPIVPPKSDRIVTINPGNLPGGTGAGSVIATTNRFVSQQGAIEIGQDQTKIGQLIKAQYKPNSDFVVPSVVQLERYTGEIKFYNNDGAAFAAGTPGCYRVDYYPDYEKQYPGNENAVKNQGFGTSSNIVIHPESLGYTSATSGFGIINSTEEVIMTASQAKKYEGNSQDLVAPISSLVDENGDTKEVRVADGTGPLGVSYWYHDAYDTNEWYHGTQEKITDFKIILKFVTSDTDTTENAASEADFKNQVPGTYYVRSSNESGSLGTITKITIIANPAIVTYDANTGVGTMVDQTIEVNKSTALNSNVFTKEGYTFMGWSTTLNGEVVYTDGQTVTLTDETGMNLFAVWQKNEVVIPPVVNPEPTPPPVVNPEPTPPTTQPEIENELEDTGITSNIFVYIVLFAIVISILLIKKNEHNK